MVHPTPWPLSSRDGWCEGVKRWSLNLLWPFSPNWLPCQHQYKVSC